MHSWKCLIFLQGGLSPVLYSLRNWNSPFALGESEKREKEPQLKAAELGKEQAQATACQCLWEAALQDKSLRSLCPGKQKEGERHLEYITEETSPGNKFYSVLLTGLRG